MNGLVTAPALTADVYVLLDKQLFSHLEAKQLSRYLGTYLFV
jgi:hypothetical protein